LYLNKNFKILKKKEKNDLIRAYLKSNPIQKGQVNCYQDVCNKFGVNRDVIKGIIRHDTSDTVYVEISNTPIGSNITTQVQTNFNNDTIELNATRDYDIKSIDDFVKENGIDLNKYKIVSAKNSTWNNGKQQLYSVSLKLEPKNTQSIENNYDNYFDSVKKLIQKSVTRKEIYTTDDVKVTNDKALFVYISDTHIGAMTETDSLYENTYNEKVFKSRLISLMYEIIKLKSIHGKFEKLYIVNLGDCIDGVNNTTSRGGHNLPQNLSNKQQFDVYITNMCQLFDELFERNLAEQLHFVSVGDSNHAGDLESLLNKTIEIYLNAKYPQIVTKVFDKFIDHIFYRDNCMIFTHGKDGKNMKAGYPLILNDATENKINEYIFERKIDSPSIHFIKGDLHQSATQEGKRFRYKNVKSLYGSSKYIHTNYGNTKSGVDWDIISADGKSVTSSCLHF
jgi:hypothetical protein